MPCTADAPGFRVWSLGQNEVDDHGDPVGWGEAESQAWKHSTSIGALGLDDSEPPVADWIIFAPRGNMDRYIFAIHD